MPVDECLDAYTEFVEFLARLLEKVKHYETMSREDRRELESLLARVSRACDVPVDDIRDAIEYLEGEVLELNYLKRKSIEERRKMKMRIEEHAMTLLAKLKRRVTESLARREEITA